MLNYEIVKKTLQLFISINRLFPLAQLFDLLFRSLLTGDLTALLSGCQICLSVYALSFNWIWNCCELLCVWATEIAV